MDEKRTVMEDVRIDMQKSTTQSNKVKDRIIMLLISLMFIDEELQDTGYDTVHMVEMQKKIHDTYRNKIREIKAK